jgi:hypothetical protein
MTPKGYKLKLRSIADKLFSALRTLSHLPAHGMTDTLVAPRDRRIFLMLFSGAKKPGEELMEVLAQRNAHRHRRSH